MLPKLSTKFDFILCTINSKINGTPKGVHLPISKLHSILSVANLLAHNNITISYYGQVNSLQLKSSVASKWTCKNLCGVPFIVLLMVHNYASRIAQKVKSIGWTKCLDAWWGSFFTRELFISPQTWLEMPKNLFLSNIFPVTLAAVTKIQLLAIACHPKLEREENFWSQ